jgi:hypothetical protein
VKKKKVDKSSGTKIQENAPVGQVSSSSLRAYTNQMSKSQEKEKDIEKIFKYVK